MGDLLFVRQAIFCSSRHLYVGVGVGLGDHQSLTEKPAYFVPIYKKGDRQAQGNYCPISLLPICGKAFEHLIHNSLFEFFVESELVSSNQSDIKPDDSCINQLLSITHEIYKTFYNGYEVI